jgi:hypothetical protein
MKYMPLGIAIGTLLLATAGRSDGQNSRPIKLVVAGGATMPTGGFKEFHDYGVHADAGLIVTLFGQSLRLRPELTYSRFNVKDAFTTLTGAQRPASGAYGGGDVSTLLGAFGNIEVPVGPLYLIAGVGGVQFKTDAGGTGNTSLSETKVSINGGAGLRFSLGPIAGFIEGRMNSISLDAGKSQFKDVKTIPISFGLVF